MSHFSICHGVAIVYRTSINPHSLLILYHLIGRASKLWLALTNLLLIRHGSKDIANRNHEYRMPRKGFSMFNEVRTSSDSSSLLSTAQQPSHSYTR